MEAVNNNRSLMAVIAAVLLLAMGLVASCGGGSSTLAELDQAGNTGNAATDIEAAAAGIDEADAAASNIGIDTAAAPAEAVEGGGSRGTSSAWYVATAGADYVNGVDILFQLWTNGTGQYEFVMKASNNSAQQQLLVFNKDRRYQFRISQNGQLRKTLRDNRNFFWIPEFRPLAPYQSVEYRRNWDGRDAHGNKLNGIVDVEARLVSSSHPSTMSAIAWMNGQ